MARPKRMKSPARLELLMERARKREAFALAVKYGISVGRLFEKLVEDEKLRTEQVGPQ